MNEPRHDTNDSLAGGGAAHAHAKSPHAHAPHTHGPSPHAHEAPPVVEVGTPRASAVPPRGKAGTWTCPMHPQIVRDAPGTCPICGMALERRTVSADDEESPELADMTRRLVVSSVLTLPLLLIMIDPVLFRGTVHRALAGRMGAFELAFATPVVLWGGWPFFVRGGESVVRRSLNMFTLIALGVGVAYGYSVAATIAPGAFPASFRDAMGEVARYFEPAAVIVTLVLVGQVLELRARSHTGSAIRALLELAPDHALRVEPRGDREVPLAEVRAGDLLRVRPGQKVPVDGIVVEGGSAVDESLVSGESMPVEKSSGERVVGGAINGTGSFVMRAEHVGDETLLARIVQRVADAQRSRAPIQRLADRVSAWFVPAVMLVALATFVVWALAGPEPRMAWALVNAVGVLIIACPCALGLATPISIMVAVGKGATMGVLFRDAAAIETLRKAETLIVDKTGTLTEGRPRVVRIAAHPGTTESDVLRIAASLERGSEHPLAAAILAAAIERRIETTSIDRFDSVTGRGVRGTIDGRAVALGNAAMLGMLGVPFGPLESEAEAMRSDGQTVIAVAAEGHTIGLIGVADPLKATTPPALAELRKDGIRTFMATGDHRATAEAIARGLALDGIEAEVLPERKLEIVREHQARGEVVTMAGDGINDAPALAQADVGIAMGTGTDVAMESAGVTLVRGDLHGIVQARRLSEATIANIRQNLIFAFVYNVVGVPIAAGVLYPATGLLLNPMIAAAAMSLSSVSVIGNALRLRRLRM